jgi:hypothetical protein
MIDKPLFLLMEEAFDDALQDDCFYEWNKVAAAMLRAIANRIINTSNWGSYNLSVAYRLQKEAAIADTWDNDKRA